MEKKSHLTNEDVAKKFKSNFELVSYAIKLAENMIRTGRDARVKAETQNRAMLILEEINQGKDQFDQITEQVASEPEGMQRFNGEIRPESIILVDERVERRKAKYSFTEEE